MGELPQIASSIFPVRLCVEALDDDIHWRVCEDFYCVDDVLGRIDVPAGTITDFGSIPKIVQSLISPTNRYRKPFVIHDTNYTNQVFTQKQSDDCLLRQMQERDQLHNKIAKWYQKKFGLERMTIYLALRAGGWVAWNENKRRNK